MPRRLSAVLAALVIILTNLPAASTASAASCQFTLGFQALHDLIPTVVGDCLEDQHYAANGDAQQQTTGGLLVWRKSDNWTAFTDGYRTWLNGPFGVESRLNAQRFLWEGDWSPANGVAESATEAAMCKGVPGDGSSPLAIACATLRGHQFDAWVAQGQAQQPQTLPPAASAPSPAPTWETATLVGVSPDGLTILVVRASGVRWTFGLAGPCLGAYPVVPQSILLSSDLTEAIPSKGDVCTLTYGNPA